MVSLPLSLWSIAGYFHNPWGHRGLLHVPHSLPSHQRHWRDGWNCRTLRLARSTIEIIALNTHRSHRWLNWRATLSAFSGWEVVRMWGWDEVWCRDHNFGKSPGIAIIAWANEPTIGYHQSVCERIFSKRPITMNWPEKLEIVARWFSEQKKTFKGCYTNTILQKIR